MDVEMNLSGYISVVPVVMTACVEIVGVRVKCQIGMNLTIWQADHHAQVATEPEGR